MQKSKHLKTNCFTSCIGCVLILYLSILSCFAQEKVQYPVIWNEWLGIQSLSDIPATLSKADYPASLNLMKQDVTITVNNCNQYFALKEQGYEAANNMEIGVEGGEYITRCIPLKLLQSAQPAQKSYVRNFNLAQDYGLLPADLILNSNIAQASHLPGNVKQAASHFKFMQVEPGDKEMPESIRILSDKEGILDEHGLYAEGLYTWITVLARGDFTHSGMDQLMLWIGHRLIAGTFHWYQIYILQRNAEDAEFQVVRELPFDKVLDQAPAEG